MIGFLVFQHSCTVIIFRGMWKDLFFEISLVVYLGDQFPILSITVYFEMLYRILVDETNFLENKNLCLNFDISLVFYEIIIY